MMDLSGFENVFRNHRSHFRFITTLTINELTKDEAHIMKPTIREVAELAKVSISTVSRVLNNPEMVVESKRLRVQEVIKQLNYQPNALARGLISKKSNTIAAMFPDIRNPFYGGIIRGMEDAAKRMGYNLMICNTDRDKSHLISYFQSFYEKQIDGILFASDAVYRDYYEEMQRYKFPVVLVCTHTLEFDLPSIRIDDEQAAYDAVSHLIQQGHRHIGLICFSLTDSVNGKPRYEGFQRALREHGLTESMIYAEFAGDWFDDSYAATGRLFQKNPNITAVFATSDEFALGAISYLNDQGIAVPADVSVVGFDDIRFARMTIPKLTTIAQPVYDLGYQSVEMLNEQISTGSVKVPRQVLPHQLVIRESTTQREKAEKT